MVHETDLRTYARGFQGRFGTHAAVYARDYAEQLMAYGDDEGHNVWQRVADFIEQGCHLTVDIS